MSCTSWDCVQVITVHSAGKLLWRNFRSNHQRGSSHWNSWKSLPIPHLKKTTTSNIQNSAGLCHQRSSNWHGIRSKWVKDLKSVHLCNDTTNRVESFFSKLKKYCSPRSSLKETLSGLMSCLHSMRSERRYGQVQFLNRVKVCVNLDGTEDKYKKILTT